MQANTDTESVTGFETTIPVEWLPREMKLLFPTVADVKTDSLEYVDEAGDTVTENTVVIYLREEQNTEESQRMEQWLDERYGGRCNVIYLTK